MLVAFSQLLWEHQMAVSSANILVLVLWMSEKVLVLVLGWVLVLVWVLVPVLVLVLGLGRFRWWLGSWLVSSVLGELGDLKQILVGNWEGRWGLVLWELGVWTASSHRERCLIDE
jgi:hypothetical protein